VLKKDKYKVSCSFPVFLQKFISLLYKAKHVFRSYPTLACDNEVEMLNKRCPTDPFKCFLLIVARDLHRTTMLYSLRRDQKAFNSNKI